MNHQMAGRVRSNEISQPLHQEIISRYATVKLCRKQEEEYLFVNQIRKHMTFIPTIEITTSKMHHKFNYDCIIKFRKEKVIKKVYSLRESKILELMNLLAKS